MGRHRGRPHRTWYGRRAAPGKVWVSRREYNRLLGQALQVAHREAEVQVLEAETRAAELELAALRRARNAATLLERQVASAEVTFSALETRGLLANLPAQPDGALDEGAFVAFVDEHIWARRLDSITTDV